MEPAPGERLLRFVGDRVRFTLRAGAARPGWRALLRTNLGRAAARRREIISAHAGGCRRRRSLVARRANAKKRRRVGN